MSPEDILAGIKPTLDSFVLKANEEFKRLGTVTDETKNALTKLQAQTDEIDKKMQRQAWGGGEHKTLAQELKEDEHLARLINDKRGIVRFTIKGGVQRLQQERRFFERKDLLISGVGTAAAGVVPIERVPGIVPEAREELRIRDVLASRPTAMTLIYYVKVNAAMAKASPQTEGSAKAENAVTFTVVDEAVRTIATWLKASRQILDDWDELLGFLRTALAYAIDIEEDEQLLFGSGAGVDLNGLTTQADAFDTSLLIAADGWNKIDVVGRSIQQIAADMETSPTFVVLNPADWWDMRLQKDSYGRYLLGDPQTVVPPSLFGLTVVPTTVMTAGYFLTGSGRPLASEVRPRMDLEVQISTEDEDNFQKNLVTVRAEKREALVVYRPNSYKYGQLTTSP